MKVTEAILISLLGLAGSAMGSFFTARAAADSAQIQSNASLVAATVQTNAARDTARSEAAIKIMEFRAAPMADLYVANSKLQAANYGEDMNSAAKQLATAAASASARLDGKAGSICLDIAEKAIFFANAPDEAFSIKADARGRLAKQVTELRQEFEIMQRQTVSTALF
jgi:hypothetical protein